jgi:peptidoglycan/xylan/chitin deacetylase (PgdA/CDA1 family)
LPPEAVAAELDDSRRAIADRLDEAPRTFAYPYGDVDAAVATAAAARFSVAVSTQFACLSPADRPALLPRLDMYYFRKSDALEAMCSPAFGRRLGRIRLQRRIRSAIT